MIMNCFYKLLILCALLTSGIAYTGTAQTLSLSGNDWEIKDFPNDSSESFCRDWIPATVPGNIQSDLENARILNPLWYGAGDARLYDVPKNNWYYRKNFEVPEDFDGKLVRLVFDGVDYACEVWLNGIKIGVNLNMFRRFEFDIAGILKIGGTNLLEIRLASIPAVLALYIEKSDGKFIGFDTEWDFVDGVEKTLEELKDLKSPTNFGYDWGVNIWTLGIWKDVRIEASGVTAIEYLKIETPLSDDFRNATVQVNAMVNSLAKEQGTLRLKISGNGVESFAESPFSVIAGSNNIYSEVVLENPALWWPNGHGEQNLYNLEATLVDDSGKLLHKHNTRFGVREVRWQLTSEAPDDFPEKYMPVVNGRKIRMIGSNLIPPDLMFARIPERAPHLLRLAKASGFTTLRLWGGGVIFSNEVYDLADELGIMLMLEMPMANIDPKPDPELLNNLDTTLRNIIHQVWNHPSIIEYTGGNEMKWGQDGNDFTVIERMRRIFEEEDPGRVFRDTDPVDGGMHGPWSFLIDQSNPVDPVGVYSCWNQVIPRVIDKGGSAPAGPHNDLYPFMRYGEFAHQTSAHLEVWQRTIPPAAQWPINKENAVLIRKNAFFEEDGWLHKPVIDFLFGESPDLEILLKAGQYVGAEGLRYAVDAARRRGDATGGILTWDFNEPWTNGAGSYQVDYDGRPLMNYAFMKQAVAPLSLSLRHPSSLYNIREGIRTTLYLTSDAELPAGDLHWSWKARNRLGAVISSGKGSIKIEPLEVKRLTEIFVKLPEKTDFGPVLMELQLSDSNGKVLHERVHIFGQAGVGSPFRGLLDKTAPRPIEHTTLELEASESREEGKEEVLELNLTNTGKMTALFCEPKPVLNYRTDMIIDNLYVCIPPGESRTVMIRAPRNPEDGLTLGQTGWKIESWNASTLLLDPSSDILLSLGRKDQMCIEFAGYPGLAPAIRENLIHVEGRLINPAQVPYLFEESKTLELVFGGTAATSDKSAFLRIHTSDQSTRGATLSIELNGERFEAQLGEGYGFQNREPAHFAQAKTIELKIPAGVVKSKTNLLRIKVTGEGWFSWDALDLKQ